MSRRRRRRRSETRHIRPSRIQMDVGGFERTRLLGEIFSRPATAFSLLLLILGMVGLLILYERM